MQKLFYSILFVAYSIVGFSQSDSTFVIEGIIYDELTGDSLENVQVFLVKDKMRIDSMFSNEVGKYRFEIFEDGCYDLIIYTNRYFPIFRNTCLSLAAKNRITNNFFLTRYHPQGGCICIEPQIDSFLMKYIIQDENGEIIPDIKLQLVENNNTSIFTIKNGTITFVVQPDVSYKMFFQKKGFQSTEDLIIFPQNWCSMQYDKKLLSAAEYELVIKENSTIKYHLKTNIILKKTN